MDFLWDIGASLSRWLGVDPGDFAFVLFLALWSARKLVGTTVQTGTHGLKFSWGRAVSVLEPGFHPLIPGLQTVRHIPTRSRTLDLPTQRVRSVEGLVYEVNVNITYQVDDVKRALVEVDDLERGLSDALAVSVQRVMAQIDRAAMADIGAFDARLRDRIQEQVRQWGVRVEQAGFTTVNPVGASLRLTQLKSVMAERFTTLTRLQETGLSRNRALTLMGSRTRYHPRTRMFRWQERAQRARRTPPRQPHPSPEWEPSAWMVWAGVGVAITLLLTVGGALYASTLLLIEAIKRWFTGVFTGLIDS